MKRRIILFATVAAALAPLGVSGQVATRPSGPDPSLPAPNLAHSAEKRAVVVGWRNGRTPKAPDGFTVRAFATGLDYPRWMHVLPNGDVLVTEARAKAAEMSADRGKGPSADRITLLRDKNKDGVADERFVLVSNLNQPFGMAVAGGKLFVGNTDAVVSYPFKPGQTKIEASPETIFALPAGGYNNHWTRNLLLTPDRRKLLVTVGSASNVGEHGLTEERNRAAIHEIELDGSEPRIVAGGLRNPIGLDYEPESGVLWTAVNERDRIGDDLVPDYITSVRDGGFYGWPYLYWGKNPDPRLESQDRNLIETSIAPDYALGAHTASMSVRFYRGEAFPEAWRKGAFVGQHGSWNRDAFSGYKVLFVPFEGGRPVGEPKDFLTGFVADESKAEVHGRPTGVEELADGSLLVTDDAGDTIWRVSAAK